MYGNPLTPDPLNDHSSRSSQPSTTDSTHRPHGLSSTRTTTASNVNDDPSTNSAGDTHSPSTHWSPADGSFHPASYAPPEAYPGYYFYGYYPPDLSMGYPLAFSATDPPSYSRIDDTEAEDPQEDTVSTERYPSPTGMMAPVPMGVYYSMPMYQRQVCYPPPSGAPMVRVPFAHTMPGADTEQSHYPGMSPTSSYGTESHTPYGPFYLNPTSQVFHPAAGTEGGAPYVYHDPRYFSYPRAASHPMVPMRGGAAPLAIGYPHGMHHGTGNTETPLPRSNAPRRKKPAAPSRRRSSAPILSPGQNSAPDSKDYGSEPDEASPMSAAPVSDEVVATPATQSTSESLAQAAPGAMPTSQLHGTRSNYVMWCGNVPSDATLDELWSFFSTLPLSSPGTDASDVSLSSHGILSIFIISRSSCAFVNYEAQEHLDRACAYFHGKPLRSKIHCPRLVCRPRKLEDAEYAGVAAQRGKGVHTNWYREQCKLLEKAGNRDLGDDDSDASSTRTFSSTNSSLLRQPLFSHRFFILKSRNREALVTALRTNIWSTQPHNEPVLDQAFRNSEMVTLFFSENFSGQFFGFATMASCPGSVPNTVDEVQNLLDFSSLDDTYEPSSEQPTEGSKATAHPEDTHCVSPSDSFGSSGSPTPSTKARKHLHQDLAAAAQRHNESLEEKDVSAASPLASSETAVDKSDELASQTETLIGGSRSLQVGRPFYLDWQITEPLPFSEIQNLRNPWRDNRLIKVSRDGTELEPNVGRQLVSVWQTYLAREKKE